MQTLNIDLAKTELEKRMALLAKGTKKEHKFYIAGVLDTWEECGVIGSEDRDDIYVEYVG